MIGQWLSSRAKFGIIWLKFQFTPAFSFHSLYLFTIVVVADAMLNLSNKTAKAVKVIHRAVKGMATAAPRIGDTKVPMSLLEKGAYINYQRIEDNLIIVRDRCELQLQKWEYN